MSDESLMDMTAEALQDLNHSLTESRAELRRKKQAVVAVLERKLNELALVQSVKALEDKHGAQIQVVSPHGVESEEAVRGPEQT